VGEQRAGDVLVDYYNHFVGAAAPAGTTHALEEGRNRIGCAEMQDALQFADVNAKLHRNRRADSRLLGRVLHIGFQVLAQLLGNVAVMDGEYIVLVPFFGHFPEGCGQMLRFLTGV
jgi:hypothetical protein